MADVNIVVGIRGDDSGGRVIKRSLDDINASATRTTSAMLSLRSAFASVAAGFGILRTIGIADQFQNLNSRIQEATRLTGDFNRVQKELISLSTRTGTSLESNVTLFQRLAGSARDLGMNNQQILELAETVNKLGIVGGASVDGMKNATLQLAQALSGGTVRAEEFNSIVENMKPVVDAVAKSMGISFGELRRRVVEGEMASRDFAQAIRQAKEEADASFGRMPVTVGRATENLRTNLGLAIDDLNRTTGATNILVEALNGIGEGVKNAFVGSGSYLRAFLIAMQEVNVSLAEAKLNLLSMYSAPDALKDKIFGTRSSSVESAEKAAMNVLEQQEKLQRMINEAVNPATTSVAAAANQTPPPPPISKVDKKAADKAAREALQEQKKLQDQLTDAVKQSRTEQEQLLDTIQDMERLRGFAKTAEQADAISKNIKNARGELDKLRAEAELDAPMGQAFKRLADEIDDGFKDAFKSAFDPNRTGNAFKSMLDGLRNMFVNFLADLVYQAAIRPIVVSIAGSFGSAMGLSSNAVGSVLGAGGSGGTGGIGSLLSMGKSFMNGGVGTGLGNFAGKTSAFLGGSFQQNLAVQKFFTNAGSFGNLAGGFVGGMGANLIGLGNKNAMVNGITGTLGGLAGSAFGPVGSAVGSFLGTALGGLFGGKKPSDKAEWGGINLLTGSQFGRGNLKGGSPENEKILQTLFDQLSGYQQLVKGAGGRVNTEVFATVGSRDGLRLGTGANEKNFGNNLAAFLNSALKQAVQGTRGLSDTFSQILKKVGTDNLNVLKDAFAFGSWYDSLGKVTDPLADAMKSLNAEFDKMRSMAAKLGFPLEKINTEYDKQKTALEGSIKAQKAGFSSFEQLTAAFDDFFNGQALGANSTLTPMGKLQAAQSQFGGLLSKAQGGDLSVTPNLLSAANSLLSTGRDVYASGVDFSGIESFVKSSVQGVASQAGYTGQNVSYSIISTNQLVANNIVEMKNEISRLSAELFRLSNKMAANK